MDGSRLTDVVLGLDRWFEAMRVDWPSPGYGGAVVHWWGHSLAYRGAGFDWRYEGIIDGYLALWRRSDDPRWLEKAIRAGDDLIAGQRADGRWTNSRFELNPGTGGTPHEAACTVALLLLARALETVEPGRGERALSAARRAFADGLVGRLWHEPSSTLWDAEGVDSFVPNKAATFIETTLLLAAATGDRSLIERYAIPTAARIVALQIRRPGNELDGAIAQNRLGGTTVESYFPLYVARCVPGLLALAAASGDESLRGAALAAAAFVSRVREDDGGLPQVLYGRERLNRAPRWVAGAGDVVRALTLARGAGLAVDPRPTIDWILGGARGDGRIATAEGFGRLLPLISRRDRFADELGVVGWCDKAFRALASLADPVRLTKPQTVEPVVALETTSVVR